VEPPRLVGDAVVGGKRCPVNLIGDGGWEVGPCRLWSCVQDEGRKTGGVAAPTKTRGRGRAAVFLHCGEGGLAEGVYGPANAFLLHFWGRGGDELVFTV